MLYLIGAGVAFDLTLGGLEALKSCDEAYLERYTNAIGDARIAELERIAGKKITILPREKVESSFLIGRAKECTAALLSSGDPLTATTHVTLLMEAREKGVEAKVIHNSSVYSAAPGKAGLQIYKFGRTATLVNPRPGYRPTSSLDIIRQNVSLGMHTLVLLDTEPAPMEAKHALGMLKEFGSAVVLSRLGEVDERVSYGKAEDLGAKGADLGKPPFCIIIPGKLHPVEEEFLAQVSGGQVFKTGKGTTQRGGEDDQGA